MSRDSPGAPVPPREPAPGPSSYQSVQVRAGEGLHDYTVVVGRGLLARLPELLGERLQAHRWAVISDETVAGLYADQVLPRLSSAGLDARLFTFAAGERHKTRESWARLTDALLAAGYGRDSAVIALGGGVTGDLAGFVAATLLRGVPVVQVPTTLVAMIDAAVGGKTAVDTPAGKNLVGAFHPPRLVLVDPETVRTLPQAERAQGLVEALKHALIVDAAYLQELEAALPRLLQGDVEATVPAVLRSIEIKAEVVSKDEREGGYRQILNFGHTLGHALEGASAYELPHGSAVAVGMVLEARLGERIGITEPGTSHRIGRVVEALGLSPVLPEGTALERVRACLGTDKKRREGQVHFVLLRRVGEVHAEGGWAHPLSEEWADSLFEDMLTDV